MRIIYLLLSLVFIIGCSSRSSEYLLPKSRVATIGSVGYPVGLKEVEVPEYLNSDKIVYQKGVKLYKVDANFATTPSKLLTHNAIVTLKSALDTPNVQLYPWDFKSTRGVIVTIKLDDFIYKDGLVVVRGSYYIKNVKGKLLSEKNFDLHESSSEDVESVVENLSKLFNKVVLKVAEKIAR
jgi:uncharacterized lipoprotein YmbA